MRPYIDYKKAHFQIATELQEQADRALRHFAHEGDLEWINLLLSAGADPRSCGLRDDGCEDPECHSTALQEACSGDHLEVLKGFNPDPARDDLPDLLSCSAALGSNETIQYLLQMGVDPNDKPNGGSSALDRCFWNLGLADIGALLHKQLVSRMAAWRVLESTRDLPRKRALLVAT